MSIFSDINPNTTSGNQLATILNSFKDSFASGNAGATRDPNLVAGGTWVDNASVTDVLIMYLYDGTVDTEIYRLNTATQSVSFPGGGDSFLLARESDDAIGPILSFLKKRASGSKQTQDGDTISELQFKAFSDTSTEETTSRIRILSEDNATSTVHGSSMIFETTAKGGGTLTERLRIDNQGNVGLGTTAPEAKIHVNNGSMRISKTGDDAVGSIFSLAKARDANNGQVLTGDVLGEYEFRGTDVNGNVYPAASVKAVATEDHTTGLRGTKLVLESITTGGISTVTGIEVDGANVTIAGQSQNSDVKSSAALQDDTLTRNLTTIDGALWKRFIIDVGFWGRGTLPETRAQEFKITGIYDTNTTSWFYRFEGNTLTDTDDLIDLSFSNGQVLTIDYLNKIGNAIFTEGRIDMELRRIA
jgi:hypothetical protein